MASRFGLLVVLLASVTFAACSGSDTEGADETGATADDVDRGEAGLLVSGTLTVCVDAPKYPFAFQDSNGNWLGADIEILTNIADDLDLTLAIVTVPFDGIWRAPAAGTCDLAAAAITITDARAGEAAFSDPYMDAGQSLLVRKPDADAYASLASLAGRNIAVKTGTTSEEYLTANLPGGATIVALPDTEALFVALGSSDVDGVVADFPLNGYRSTLDTAVTVTERFDTGEQYGFAAASDNLGLIDDLNDALADYLPSDDYQDLLFRWFGQ